MGEIKIMNTIQECNDYFGVETLHPLVSVVEARKAGLVHFCPKLYNVYTIVMKDIDCGTLKYGRSTYDYQQGSVLFLSPGQMMGSRDDGKLHQPKGWLLFFHPELLHGTPLAKSIKDYSYFSYQANEALHLSESERQTFIDCMGKIAEELRQPIDKHSKSLIVGNIKLLLDYCERFYDRQFTTRKTLNQDLLIRFENLLNNYFVSDAVSSGILSVQYCADKLCLSPNYLSDLIKKETGMSALKHIQQKTLAVSKERIYDTNRSISEISYELGFPYPQHFSRWFKKMEGCTPNEYRTQIHTP